MVSVVIRDFRESDADAVSRLALTAFEEFRSAYSDCLAQRYPHPAADQVRSGDKCEGRKGAGTLDSAIAAVARRRGD
jgi:hypothetical protein